MPPLREKLCASAAPIVPGASVDPLTGRVTVSGGAAPAVVLADRNAVGLLGGLAFGVDHVHGEREGSLVRRGAADDGAGRAVLGRHLQARRQAAGYEREGV